jgi:hypothetical protein
VDVKYQLGWILALSGALSAQTSTTYRYDVNGRPISGVTRSLDTNAAGSQRAETVRNVNGREVPIETAEQKVLRDDGTVKVIERVVRRYDANGRPGPSEKITIEERKNSDGSVNATTTVMREDLNGRMSLAERSNSESRKSGDTVTTTMTVERPTLNGSLEMIERREASVRETKESRSESATVYKRDVNGRFGEAAREQREARINGQRTEENAAFYVADPNGGGLKLLQQVVSTTNRVGNNVETELNIYQTDTAGKVGASSEARPRLAEQQIIERRATGTGTVESVSVRRAAANDPGKLSAPQKVEETVCTGCKP